MYHKFALNMIFVVQSQTIRRFPPQTIAQTSQNRFYHRYRRPRLLTVVEFIRHARGNYEHSKWRLNRAKIIEWYRGKPCFLHFTSSYSFRSRHNTLFWKELTDAKVLNVYLYNLSSLKSK